MRKKCPYFELFWSVFSRIRTDYGEILRISPYSVRMLENTDQNNSAYGQFFAVSSSHIEHSLKYLQLCETTFLTDKFFK